MKITPRVSSDERSTDPAATTTRFRDGYNKKERAVVGTFSAAPLENLKNIGQLFFSSIDSIVRLEKKKKKEINAACFALRSFFVARRCMCMTLKTRRFRSSSERQTIESGAGGGEGYGRRCIRAECIVPSFFAVKNKLPTARAGRAVYIFFFCSLTFSVRERPRLKRLYYRRASPRGGKKASRRSHPRRELAPRADRLREQRRGAGNK